MLRHHINTSQPRPSLRLLLLLCAWSLLSTVAQAQVILPPDPDAHQVPATPVNPGSRPTLPAMSQPWNPGTLGNPTSAPLSDLLGEATLVPPKEILRLPPLWPYYLGVSLVGLFLLAALVFWLIRRNRRPRPIPVIPADVRALNALESLRELIRESRAREFSYQASEIIRGYIEDRFDLSARNRTTREFLSQGLNEARGISQQHHESLQQFLQYCDLAKFARQLLTPEQMEAMFRSAAGFIRDTRPSIMAAPDATPSSERRKEVHASS